MRLFGVKGFPEGAEIPTLLWQVRAKTPERAVDLVRMTYDIGSLTLVAVDIGGGRSQEGISPAMPWPWPDKAA